MDAGSAQRPSLLAALGLTVRRLIVICSESIFLVAGILIGFKVLPELARVMDESDVELAPEATLALDWYWVLLMLLAGHILLWPVVARFLGGFGLAIWYVLAALLPLSILAVPTIFVLSAYIAALEGGAGP